MNLNINYHPEPYRAEVAEGIDSRGAIDVLEGDDTPFYRYKRKKFLQLFNEVDFEGKKVLEIGCGSGGNLLEVYNHKPEAIYAADMSQSMISLAMENLANKNVNFAKFKGEELPFENEFFDIVFSAAVLQHNTDEMMMQSLLKEMCRVSKGKVILFERIEDSLKGDESCMGRPVDYYANIGLESDFELTQVEFINIQASYLVSGSISKLLNSNARKEDQYFTKFVDVIQKLTLPVTSVLDKIYKAKRDLAKIEMTRKV